MSKAYDRIERQLGHGMISTAGGDSVTNLAVHYAEVAATAALDIARLGQTIHRLEMKLGKRRRKSARQHNALSNYKRRDYYAMKTVETQGGTYQFPALTTGASAARLP